MAPLSTAQRIMLALIVAAIPASIIGAIYPGNTWLQVGPVIVTLPFVPAVLRRWPVSGAGSWCVTLFILLHLFGARWSYSYVPYETWGSAALGADFNAAMGWNRNMFDRLVHFSFGALITPVATEVLQRYAKLSLRMAVSVAVLTVLAVSCVYEIFEWSLTMFLAPADAGAYNGEQGDRFDSQKDMAIAALGSILVLPWALRHREPRQRT